MRKQIIKDFDRILYSCIEKYDFYFSGEIDFEILNKNTDLILQLPDDRILTTSRDNKYARIWKEGKFDAILQNKAYIDNIDYYLTGDNEIRIVVFII